MIENIIKSVVSKVRKVALVGAGCAVLAAPLANAVLPTFKTKAGYGNAALPPYVYFPADPNSQIRLVGINYSSDTNNGAFNFYTGGTALTQTLTNYNTATTSITNCINSTNGLAAGALLVLEHLGLPYTNTVASLNFNTNAFGTNVVLSTGGWGVIPTPGDPIYVLSTPMPIPTGITTNAINGDAIFVGNFGRPVLIIQSPVSTTGRIYSATVHYDKGSD